MQRRAGHPEVERDDEVELALGGLVTPANLARPMLGRRLLRRHRVRRDPEQVLEEVLVALARGAEQV